VVPRGGRRLDSFSASEPARPPSAGAQTHQANDMTTRRHLWALALAAGGLAAGAAAPGVSSPLAPGSSPAQENRGEEFRTKFRQAMEIADKDAMAKLVRLYQREASQIVMDLCEAIPEGTNESIEKEVAALSSAWKTSLKSNFVDIVYKYFSRMSKEEAKARTQVGVVYNAAFRRYTATIAAKDGPGFDKSCIEFESIAADYEKVGDYFYAARAWNVAATCVDLAYRTKDQADLPRVARDLKRCVEDCGKIEFNDTWFVEVKARYEGLKHLIENEAGGDANGGNAAPSVPVASSAAVPVAAQFEAVPALDAFERPNYHADEIYPIWPSVYLRAKGSNGNFLAIGKLPRILRLGSSQLSLDFDGDDKPDQDFPMMGNKTVVQFPIGQGDEHRQWACITELGTNKDSFQGLQVNLSADDNQCSIYVLSAASVVGTLNGTKLRVIDDNMDGKYGSPPQPWQYQGLLAGDDQPDIDCVVVGDGKRARPWSEYLEVGGAWYQMEPVKVGMSFNATPVTLETGKLKLVFKGEPPAFVIVQGTEKLEKSCFDLLQNGPAEVDVPVGRYKLLFGILRKGKKSQVMKALILPSKTMADWRVEAGKTTTISLGAPFAFDFEQHVEGEKLTVTGASVVVTGSSGERYERLWNCVPRPEVSWRKAGTKKASKSEKMPVVLDLNEQDEKGMRKYDWAMTWQPLNLVLEVKLKTGESAEAQLVEKKNKLFGEIESSWK
jgi:hypothetical protein